VVKATEYNPEGLPIIPPLDPMPTRPVDGAVAICGQCGLRILPVMCYVCPSSNCPVFFKVTL
jgi:hypothetical protein